MHRLVLICVAGFLFVSTIPRMTKGTPLSFLRDRVQEEADEEAAIEQNEIDRDIVVAPPLVVTQTRQSQKGKKRFQITHKEWVQMSKNPPEAIKIPLRSQIELECEAVGAPAPQIHWLRGADPVRQLDELMGNSIAEINTTPGWGGIAKTRSRLVIDCASPRDEGLIHCAAVSGSKTIISKPTMLMVIDLGTLNGSSCGTESRPRVTLNSPMVMALMGTSVSLPCRASGKPRAPRTFWTDNNDRLITSTSNPRFKITGSGELVIFPLDWDDMGGFTCIAQSGREKDTAGTFLYPMAEDVDES